MNPENQHVFGLCGPNSSEIGHITTCSEMSARELTRKLKIELKHMFIFKLLI